MNVSNTTDFIRQQQIGQFRQSDDGKGPFLYTAGKKLDKKEWKESSLYVSDKVVATFTNDMKADSRKLFDSHIGIEIRSTGITSESKKEEGFPSHYDKAAKTQTMAERGILIDQIV